MITIMGIFLLLFCIWLTFKIVPAMIGFAFTVFLVVLQVVGVIFLLPILGLACFLIDAAVICALVAVIKAIFL